MRALEALGIMDCDQHVTKVRNKELNEEYTREGLFDGIAGIVLTSQALNDTYWQIGRDCDKCCGTGLMSRIGKFEESDEEYQCPDCDDGMIWTDEY